MATSLPPGVPNFDACTYATCPVELYGQIAYRPSLGGNAFCAAVFGIALIIQLGLGIRYRTWGFLFATVSGSVLEIIGYAGRIMLWQNDYDFNNFVIYLVCLTISPAFYSAAIYLCLARIIAVVGRDRSRFSPKAITQFFIVCDIISLVLQAAGGALAATADTQASSSEGQHIMEAGLAFQTVSMTAFMTVCSQLLWAVQKRGSSNEESVGLRRSKGFCFFLSTLSIATVCIFVRCVFRVAELSKGFNSKLANNEVEFMILESTMMLIAIICLTIGHPGPFLGSMWTTGGFRLRKQQRLQPHGTEEMVFATK